MKAVVQRVNRARVLVGDRLTGQIDSGLVIFLGIEEGDQEEEVDRLAKRVAHLRIFADQKGKSNLSLVEIEGQALVVSQFTLCANTESGRRPSFIQAAAPEEADRLYQMFQVRLREEYGLKVASGEFGAMMTVEAINDGPATFILEEKGRGGKLS